jgi:hypothetical protein
MLEHLKTLAAHLESLDSGSKDAAAIKWAVAEIERLGKCSSCGKPVSNECQQCNADWQS